MCGIENFIDTQVNWKCPVEVKLCVTVGQWGQSFCPGRLEHFGKS